ncbi:hypothetical protein GCM10020254_80040 [Streptomyces goshikiensis]
MALMLGLSLVMGTLVEVATVGILDMDASHLGLLWLYSVATIAVVGIGSLALFAAFGTPGMLLATIVFVAMAVPSSGATVPVQALPGFFRALAEFEPLRQLTEGLRSLLYYGAQADAGLARAWASMGVAFVAALVFGFAVTRVYDRRGLHRIPHPEAGTGVPAPAETPRGGKSPPRPDPADRPTAVASPLWGPDGVPTGAGCRNPGRSGRCPAALSSCPATSELTQRRYSGAGNGSGPRRSLVPAYVKRPTGRAAVLMRGPPGSGRLAAAGVSGVWQDHGMSDLVAADLFDPGNGWSTRTRERFTALTPELGELVAHLGASDGFWTWRYKVDTAWKRRAQALLKAGGADELVRYAVRGAGSGRLVPRRRRPRAGDP